MNSKALKTRSEDMSKYIHDNLERLSEIILHAHERYKIENYSSYTVDDIESIYNFSKTETFENIVHDITEVAKTNKEDLIFWGNSLVYTTLDIMFKLALSQYYQAPDINEKGETIEPRKLSRIGEKAPYAPFLQYVIKHVITDLQCIVWYQKEITDNLKKNEYSISFFDEITPEYLISELRELDIILLNSIGADFPTKEKRIFELQEKLQKKYEHLTYLHNNTVTHPLEKAGRNTFSNFNEFNHDKITNEYFYGFLTQKREDRGCLPENIGITITVSFEKITTDLGIKNELTVFDYAVHNSVATLLYHGNKRFSIFKVAKTMGYQNDISQKTISDINSSIIKMMHTYVLIDNQDEAKKYNYPSFKTSYVPILPLQKVEEIDTNSYKTKGTYYNQIHYEHVAVTPLFDFALSKKQITELPLAIYQAPVRKTDINLKIRDYLLFRIKTDKPDTNTHEIKILVNSVLKDSQITKENFTNINTFKANKKRAKQNITKYLSYWESNCTGLINSWRLEKNNKGDEIIVIKKTNSL